MTVRELREALEQYQDDAEVRIAIQPHYPLQSTVAGVVSDREIDALPEGADEDEETVVWIVEEDQVRDDPYAPRAVFDAV
jgi:hypothetical protein